MGHRIVPHHCPTVIVTSCKPPAFPQQQVCGWRRTAQQTHARTQLDLSIIVHRMRSGLSRRLCLLWLEPRIPDPRYIHTTYMHVLVLFMYTHTRMSDHWSNYPPNKTCFFQHDTHVCPGSLCVYDTKTTFTNCSLTLFCSSAFLSSDFFLYLFSSSSSSLSSFLLCLCFCLISFLSPPRSPSLLRSSPRPPSLSYTFIPKLLSLWLHQFLLFLTPPKMFGLDSF